jgi:hypothetical protein
MRNFERPRSEENWRSTGPTVTPLATIARAFPYMSAMFRPYSARFCVAPMMDWTEI